MLFVRNTTGHDKSSVFSIGMSPTDAEKPNSLAKEKLPKAAAASLVGHKKKFTSSASTTLNGVSTKPMKRKRNKKPKREEGAPTPPKNGYVRYMTCRRDEIRSLFPGKTAIEITKIIAEEWNQLSNESKRPFLEAAEADKERYIRQLVEYNSMKNTEKLSPECDIQKILLGDNENENFPANNNGFHPLRHSNGHQSKNGGEVGIQIFTEEFLEHNKTADAELRMLRKSNIDYEQQNAVLEKHIENMKMALSKMEAENDAISEKNSLLALYLCKLKTKLVNAFSSLPLPGQPTGATFDNIDNYMEELYSMSTSNSHGPALNKAKDIVRKLDLHIEL